MNKISLKLKLIIAFTVIATVVFGMAAVVSHREAREEVDGFFDMYQMALIRQLAVVDWSTVTPDNQKQTDKLIADVAGADAEDDSVAFAVFDVQGQMIFHDDEKGRAFEYIPQTGRFVRQEVDGETWRMIWLPTVTGKHMVAVGQSLDYRQDIIWDVTEEFVLPWGIGLAVMLLMMIGIITAAFFPITKLARQVRHRQPDNLSPLPMHKLPAEIQPLVTAMNTLLAKIEKMVAKERSFIADSAHELRSPLTALKVQLEVLELAGNDMDMRQNALVKLAAGIDRSTRLVEQLLALSKAESVAVSTENEKLDWALIVEQLIEEYQPTADEKQMVWSLTLDGKGPFEKGCPVLATLLVRNLLDNAIKYGTVGATVTVCVGAKFLSVTNTGVTVSADVLERIGQRFYRPAGQAQTGSGLGLSIVQRIAHIYRCRLKCRNTDDGFEVKVESH